MPKDGRASPLERRAVYSDFSCCSRVAAKAAGLEKSRFFSVFSTNSVANFSALSSHRTCRSSAYLRSAAWMARSSVV